MAASRDRHESSEVARLLSLAINETDRAVMVLDRALEIVFVNRAFCELFGYAPEEVMGLRPTSFLLGEKTNPATVQYIRSKANTLSRFNADVLFYSKSGRELWISATVNPIHDQEGEVTNLVTVLVDITETKKIRQMQESVLEAVACGLALPEIADLLCRHIESIAPDVISSMLAIDDDEKLRSLAGPRLPSVYTNAIDGLRIGEKCGSCGTAAFRGEAVSVTDIETDPLWEDFKTLVIPLGLKSCWSSPIKLRNGHVAGTFAFYYQEKCTPSALHKELVNAGLHLCTVAFERDEARRKIAHLSQFDSLTGLKNRPTFARHISETLAAFHESSHALFVVAPDYFKDINDTFGHPVGDQILIEIGYRMQRLAEPHGTVCRLSGDSFAVLLPHYDAAQAAAFADRLMKELKKPIEMQGMPLSLSFSIGISITDAEENTAETYLERAIAAVYKAKDAGRSCYHFFSPEMNQLAQERLILGAALRTALAQNTLHLVYQPQFSLNTNELTGVEALCRWNDSLLGSISPSRFIPLAEEIGEIESIGRWSLREACRQMASWRNADTAIPVVSVNLSALNLSSGGIEHYVADLLREYDLPARCLTIEITESLMLDDPKNGSVVLHALHDLGCGLSVDDFGTGFSSLARLTHLPITELKLDRSFMRNFEEDPNAQAVAKAVIGIGKSLGMNVVAEGVEAEGQEKLLRQLGCDVVQGYLRGYPMAAHDLEDWLASSHEAPAVL